MKYSLCIGAYPGKDAIYHLEKVKKHHFHGLEYYNWWDLDLEQVAQAQARIGVGITATCTPVFNLVDESQRDKYIEGIKETIAACHMLGTKSIITQTGNVMPGKSRGTQRQVMIETLKQCAPYLEAADVTLEIEPLNGLIDHPGHFLQKSDESADIINEVASSHVKLLFDVYHQQVTEGNIINNLTTHYEAINHIHIADNPGRNQPGTGELNYQMILSKIKALGYTGYIGLESNFTIDTDKALDRFNKKIRMKL